MSTFDERERQRFQGQPIEGFRFVQGSNVWMITSADDEITLPIGVFEPESITRTPLDFSQEDTGEQMEFTVPATHPVAALFIGDIPSTPVWITAYRAHRGDESESVAIFTGKITRVRFRESEAILVGTSITAMLTRAVPTLQMQSPCNHILFSAECGVDPIASRDQVTIGTVDGVTVTSSDFALRADQWFRGGYLQGPTGEKRFIGDHIGNTVTLISPMPGLASLDVCYAYWGCDHLEATCLAKFDNALNFLGWPNLPNRNPFTGRIE